MQRGPQPQEEVLDRPEATFGRLYQGLERKSTLKLYFPALLTKKTVRPNDSQGTRNEHIRTYTLRRNLANFSRVPDGYRASYIDARGRTREIIVLSPPDLVAVQMEDGNWHRERRIITEELQPPYSIEWYNEYLRVSGLPAWFLRPGHLAMAFDDAESWQLQVENMPTALFGPLAGYLERQYDQNPARPAWPTSPGPGAYIIEELRDLQPHVARRFPATNIAGIPSDVVVLPSGHIQLRLAGSSPDLPSIHEADVAWQEESEEFDHSRPVASYCIEGTSLAFPAPIVPELPPAASSPPPPPAGPPRNRNAEVNAAFDAGGIVNPSQPISGLGTVEWLSDADQQQALEKGYDTPGAVLEARRNGRFAAGWGVNAGPLIVFWPQRRFRNPATQPEGPGAWRFLTTGIAGSDEELARLSFGGSWGLPAQPSAELIFLLRQAFRQLGAPDATADIELVWIPGDEDDEEVTSRVTDTALAEAAAAEILASGPEQPPATPSPPAPSPSPEILRDPTNGQRGGEHDQTGGTAGTRPVHRSTEHNGVTVVLDRSRCRAGCVEPWKLWIYTAKGWKKWRHAASMDWNDKEKVLALNKFREQTFQRSKLWKNMRDEERADYSTEQRQWVSQFVSPAKGSRLDVPIRRIAQEFNRRFRDQRGEAGIASLLDRLRKEFDKYGGLKERKHRGWLQQEASLARKKGNGKAEEDENEDEDNDGDGEEDGKSEESEGEEE